MIYDMDGLRPLVTIPDFPIRIERIGGGASPLGFVAMLWPDELVAAPLSDAAGLNVEDWTEETCFHRALLSLPRIPSWPRTRQFANALIFAESWQRAALLHDIDDCCLAITNGALEH